MAEHHHTHQPHIPAPTRRVSEAQLQTRPPGRRMRPRPTPIPAEDTTPEELPAPEPPPGPEFKLPQFPAWTRPLPEWCCRYPFLLIVSAGVLAILWGLFGVDLGVPFLFWTDNAWEQLLAGEAVAFLLGKVCFNGYLLATDSQWMRDARGKLRPLRWYMACTWAPLLVLGIGLRLLIPATGEGAFARGFNADTYMEFLSRHAPFAIGVVLGVLISIGFTMLAERIQARLMPVKLLKLRKLKERLPDEVRSHVTERRKGIVSKQLRTQVPLDVTLHALAASSAGLFAVLYLGLAFVRPAYMYVTPALATCLMLILACDLYGAIRFHWPRAVYPVTAGIICLSVFLSRAPDKHRLIGLEEYYDKPLALSTQVYDQQCKQDCGLICEGGLPQWSAYYRQNHAAPNDTELLPKVVIVATSGGGQRSALWTATVLNELERSQPGFFYNIRLITGASGGMLGAAHYVAKLDALHQFDVLNHFRASGPTDPRVLAARRKLLESLKIAGNLEKSNLDGVVQYWALQDLPRSLCPLPYSKDRGWALEEAWRTNLDGALEQSVRSLRDGEQQGWRPSLVFAPMLVEDGRRLLISNLDLGGLTRIYGSIQNGSQSERGLYSLSAIEFFRLFPDANRFKLSTAVRLNASFPYASPVSTLPTVPYRRVVDAGYYDNFGIAVASAWIYENLPWIKQNTSGVILIQIRDAVTQESRRQVGLEAEQDPPSWLEQGTKEWTTPVSAGMAAREASMSFRNDEQVRDLDYMLNRGRPNADRFTTLVIECPVTAALSWSLTKLEVEAIQSGIVGHLNEDVEKLIASKPRLRRLNAENRSRADEVKQLLKTH